MIGELVQPSLRGSEKDDAQLTSQAAQFAVKVRLEIGIPGQPFKFVQSEHQIKTGIAHPAQQAPDRGKAQPAIVQQPLGLVA